MIRCDRPVPDIDLLCSYLSQAIEAHSHHLVLAAATMIGCAYELALLQLATAVFDKWSPEAVPELPREHKSQARRHVAGEYAKAGILGQAVKVALEANKAVLRPTGEDHTHWVGSSFSSTFQLVRELRNDAGHPSGSRVDRDEILTYIVNFRPTYRRIRRIIELVGS